MYRLLWLRRAHCTHTKGVPLSGREIVDDNEQLTADSPAEQAVRRKDRDSWLRFLIVLADGVHDEPFSRRIGICERQIERLARSVGNPGLLQGSERHRKCGRCGREEREGEQANHRYEQVTTVVSV